jgi:predicted TIM-barrel fold metal-dependent hydrolase
LRYWAQKLSWNFFPQPRLSSRIRHGSRFSFLTPGSHALNLKLRGFIQLNSTISRRTFLDAAAKTAAMTAASALTGVPAASALPAIDANADVATVGDRIVDIHTHFQANNTEYIDEFLRVSDQLNLTGCMLTPFKHRKVVADAAKKYPAQIIPFGYVDLDAPDATQQVEEFHALGYRGLGELEFVKKPYSDPSYFPVYELVNHYNWIVLFHTGIVLRGKFQEPEDVASYRMRAIYLEEIARRFPKITVMGAHCGNPEYEWASEIARWNPNVFFDLSGSTLTKLSGRLSDMAKYFWWTDTNEGTDTPNNDPSAFTKLVFGSDSSPKDVERVLTKYRAMFDACDVPEHARRLILGGTLAKALGIPD